MDKEDIKKFLPHREPMLLIETAYIDDEGVAHSTYRIKEDEFFTRGHFPGNPVVPGVILCEIMAQSCAIMVKDDLPDNMTLYVGTTTGSGGTKSPLTFDVKDNALVFFDDKVYKNGHFRVAPEDGTTIATHSIAQQSKYNAYHRFHFDYYLGASRWMTPNRNPTKLKALNSVSIKLAYSPIMNDRIGAGFGAQFQLNAYHFTIPNTELTSTDGSLNLEGYNSPSNGSWESEMLITSIDLPIHFTYFPNKNNHSTNLQLELIPQFILNSSSLRSYAHTEDAQTVSATYSQDVPANGFQLKTRLSVNFGLLGIYTEVGLTPIINNILYPPPAVPFSPHHIAFGLRINLFNAFAD